MYIRLKYLSKQVYQATMCLLTLGFHFTGCDREKIMLDCLRLFKYSSGFKKRNQINVWSVKDTFIICFSFSVFRIIWRQHILLSTSSSWRDLLDTTLYDKVWHRLATGRWFSSGTRVSHTSKSDRHDIAEQLLSGIKHNNYAISSITF
jgi:hypothetical protein